MTIGTSYASPREHPRADRSADEPPQPPQSRTFKAATPAADGSGGGQEEGGAAPGGETRLDQTEGKPGVQVYPHHWAAGGTGTGARLSEDTLGNAAGSKR